jgi:hypothetical protein
MRMIFVCVCLPIVFYRDVSAGEAYLNRSVYLQRRKHRIWLSCGMRVTFDLPIVATILQGVFCL